MLHKLAGRRLLFVAVFSLIATALLSLQAQCRNGGREPPRAIDPAQAGAQLRAQAEYYRHMAKHWRPVVAGRDLHPGDRSERVAQLRTLLELYGDYRGLPGPLQGITAGRHRYDSGLQWAVESFQDRHGLEPSGIVGAETLAELNVLPAERARRLELNADRWDKLGTVARERYVLINVPDFRLQLVEDGKVTLSMKTVVGKTSTHTPVLTSYITNVVFNPSWTVPRGILLTELLPKARNNPEAMHKRGYRVVSYRSDTTSPISPDSLARVLRGHATLRQESGADNTLGRVKFLIPNRLSIFLHDTQAQSLFSFRKRTFSHGCVRLHRPEELAYALLGRQGWDRMRIAQATVGKEVANIRVEQPPRLFITYLTAWMDNRGQLQFRRDIYHRDRVETP